MVLVFDERLGYVYGTLSPIRRTDRMLMYISKNIIKGKDHKGAPKEAY